MVPDTEAESPKDSKPASTVNDELLNTSTSPFSDTGPAGENMGNQHGQCWTLDLLDWKRYLSRLKKFHLETRWKVKKVVVVR